MQLAPSADESRLLVMHSLVVHGAAMSTSDGFLLTEARARQLRDALSDWLEERN